MKFGKLFYVIISTVIVVVIVLSSNLFSPFNFSISPAASVQKIYFADHISGALREVINRFNEKYKGQIQVIAIDLPFSKFSTNERKELFARYLRSKSDRIDLFSVDQIWVPRFAKWGVDYNKFISDEQKESLLSYALQSCSYKGKLVAIPLYLDIAVMYYREDILKKLPNYQQLKTRLDSSITWKELITLHKEMKNSPDPFYIFQADDYEGLICSFAELMADQNTSFIKNGKMKLNTPEAEKSLQLLVDLVNKYHLSPKNVIQFKEDQSYAYFLKNNGVFLRGWPSFVQNYSFDSSLVDLHNIVTVPTPHFAGSKPRYVYGGWDLMISEFSTKKNKVIKFVNYLISEEAQKILYEKGGYLPINSKIYADTEYLNRHPELKFYKRLLKSGFHRPFLERYTNISDILSYYLNLAIKEKLPVKKALKLATEKINSGSILLK